LSLAASSHESTPGQCTNLCEAVVQPIIIRPSVILLLSVVLSANTQSSGQPAQASSNQTSAPAPPFRAGACAVEIAPTSFPVLVNGGFLQSHASKIKDPIRARCLVLDDGTTRFAIVVVDTCMMPRELIDRAKSLAHAKTGIRNDRMLISATHTHSAPAAMGALGCSADENYVKTLPGLIAESIERAVRNLEPARIGWSSIVDPVHTHCRRWIRRPDKMLDDPFGGRTVRANMHPGYQNPDVIGPSGPTDPELIVLSVQSRSGRPIAVLANYSMHYYGAEPVSADYYGRFATALAAQIGAQTVEPPFVGIMSQGTSGDQMWMDYGKAKKDPGLDAYAANLARVAHQAYQSITYHDRVPLAMAETTLVLSRRIPGPERLAWARSIVHRMSAQAKDKSVVPRTQTEVYAKEANYLHDEPKRELKLQAIRIGGLGVTAIPNEVFAITGLKIKMQSPFDTTMNIELANGSEGYIPPPEQHRLGGYTTWPARTAGLDVQAEPRIVAGILSLLEQVAQKPRRGYPHRDFPYARAILASQPFAYWRLDDIEATIAVDSSKNGRSARYEGGVALYLPGVTLARASTGGSINRAVHLVGGHLKAMIDGPGDSLTVELWFWNGLPPEIRPITGLLLSCGDPQANGPSWIDLGISGKSTAPGQLYLSCESKIMVSPAKIALKTWHHIALVRKGRQVFVYLDGHPLPEISGEAGADASFRPVSILVGGRNDGPVSFEGKIDEVAVFDRALGSEEIAGHFRAGVSGAGAEPAKAP
jgi:Concanavalin A-like lectin/glucanases superfamily